MARDFGMPRDRLDGEKINYKDINLLQKYVSGQGKIIDAKRTGASAKNQRRLATAIKRARFLALMKFSG